MLETILVVIGIVSISVTGWLLLDFVTDINWEIKLFVKKHLTK